MTYKVFTIALDHLYSLRSSFHNSESVLFNPVTVLNPKSDKVFFIVAKYLHFIGLDYKRLISIESHLYTVLDSCRSNDKMFCLTLPLY